MQAGTFTNYYNYYYYFPNNLGSMSFLHMMFAIASFFGIHDYFLIGMLTNSILSISTMTTVFFICKRIRGVRHAVFSLVLFAFSLPFYFIAPAFYTDALSMLFPALYFYLYLLWKDAPKGKYSYLLFSFMVLVAFVGTLIKITVLIMVIAVSIDMFINMSKKKFIISNICIYALILLLTGLFNTYIYSGHLDKAQAEKQNDPYTHWVMMGLQGSGGYNPNDYNFTRSFEDPDERRKANIEEIKKRLHDYGISGIFDLYTIKSARSFGDGTYSLSDFLDDRPVTKNAIHEFVTYDGQKYNVYSHICEAVLFSVMLLMLWYALQVAFGKRDGKQVLLAPPLAVFGIFVFLLIWETNGRYFSNFVPVIFICAVLGIDYFIEFEKRIVKAVKAGFMSLYQS
ncbi:MAG: hypothetical protein HGA22_01645 [Clostridiales bacterium]|nr:hypothetical protein [Clostridiales bacterium]